MQATTVTNQLLTSDRKEGETGRLGYIESFSGGVPSC